MGRSFSGCGEGLAPAEFQDGSAPLSTNASPWLRTTAVTGRHTEVKLIIVCNVMEGL